MRPIDGGITAAQGFRAAGVAAGLKKRGGLDLALIVSEGLSAVAGVYTTNKVQAAPLQVTKENWAPGLGQAVIINSGCANACTGPEGLDDAYAMAEITAEALEIQAEWVGVASTGVIGVRLPMEKLEVGIPLAVQALESEGGKAAQAIMTTDTCPKEAAVEVDLGGAVVRIGGMAKGSGMIHPNMATMLGFLTTDAAIGPSLLQKLLNQVVEETFNSITVDGDTSTNDMCLIMANGLAGNELLIEEKDPGVQAFREGLHWVCTQLAKAIARDGEGASKLIEVSVIGAIDPQMARQVGKAVATSNLVKTAIYGRDANWGRILCAVGYSGAEIDPEKVEISLGEMVVCQEGRGVPFDEVLGKKILGESEVKIQIDLGLGEAQATIWTCDFTEKYIQINADYRT